MNAEKPILGEWRQSLKNSRKFRVSFLFFYNDGKEKMPDLMPDSMSNFTGPKQVSYRIAYVLGVDLSKKNIPK